MVLQLWVVGGIILGPMQKWQRNIEAETYNKEMRMLAWSRETSYVHVGIEIKATSLYSRGEWCYTGISPSCQSLCIYVSARIISQQLL